MGEKRLVRWLGALLLLGLAAIADRADAADLQALQQALAVRGYDAGVADGVYGPQTAAAIRAFEADMGWQPTGSVSPHLVRALEPPRKLPPIQLRPPPFVAARQAAGAGAEPAFINRNWLIRDLPEGGMPAGPAFSLFLEANGRVAGPRFAERMRWRAEEGVLLIRYESAVGSVIERTGRPLGADRITGEAEGPDGAAWLWTAEAKPRE